MGDNILVWLQKWYVSQCDGEWEHEYGIKIETADNPGWYIVIDLTFTNLENIELDVDSIQKDENDWYFYGIKEGKYMASGDPTKLEYLLLKFREIAEANTMI